VENLARARLGWICQKGPDAGPTGAGAKIRYIPSEYPTFSAFNGMALNSLHCIEMPLRNCSLAHTNLALQSSAHRPAKIFILRPA